MYRNKLSSDKSKRVGFLVRLFPHPRRTAQNSGVFIVHRYGNRRNRKETANVAAAQKRIDAADVCAAGVETQNFASLRQVGGVVYQTAGWRRGESNADDGVTIVETQNFASLRTTIKQ